MYDLSKLSALLEKVIEPFVGQNVAQKTLLYNFVAKKTPPFERKGLEVYVPIRTSRHAGVYGIPDSESTVGRGEAKYEQATYQVKLYGGSIEINKKLLSVPDDQQVVNHLSRITQDLMQDMIYVLNLDFVGDGTGFIGKTASAGSSTTSVELVPYNLGTDNGDITAEDILTPGDYIKIGTNPAVQVTAVNGNVITIASAQSFAAGVNVVRATPAGNPVDAVAGLMAIVNDNNFAGIDVSTTPTWKAVKDVPGTATTLTLTDMYRVYSAVNKLGECDVLFMNRTLFNKYGSILQAQVRFTPTETLQGGWRGLEFMGGAAKVILDYHIPSDAVYFVSTKNLYRLEIQPPKFEKGTEGTLLRSYGTVKYEAVLTALYALGTDVRGAFGVMGNRTA